MAAYGDPTSDGGICSGCSRILFVLAGAWVAVSYGLPNLPWILEHVAPWAPLATLAAVVALLPFIWMVRPKAGLVLNAGLAAVGFVVSAWALLASAPRVTE